MGKGGKRKSVKKPSKDSNYMNLWKDAENGHNTDVTFTFNTSVQDIEEAADSGEPPQKKTKIELYAHKQILIAASPKFKNLIGQEPNKVSLLIHDVQSNIFEILLKAIYFNKLPKSIDLETVTALYVSTVKYRCDQISFLLSNLMINHCKLEKLKEVFSYAEFAWKYDDEPLKFECEKILLENTEQVLKSPEFLKTKTMVVNRLYKYPNLHITSEKSLVIALENYIRANQKDEVKDVILFEQLEPAIGSIRFLTLGDEDIDQTFLLTDEEKQTLKNALKDKKNCAYVPRYLTTNNYNRTFLKIGAYPKELVKQMIQELYATQCWGCEYEAKHVPVSCENTYFSHHEEDHLHEEVRKISQELLSLYEQDKLWHEYEPNVIDRIMHLYTRYKEIIFKDHI